MSQKESLFKQLYKCPILSFVEIAVCLPGFSKILLSSSILLGAFIFLSASCLYLEPIEPVNKRPTAIVELRIDQELIYIGDSVFLSGENSSDPEEDELTYEWSIEFEVGSEYPYEECGDEQGSGTCNGGTKPTCCFKPTAKANYTISLRVYDKEGIRSSRVSKEIFVNNRPPEAVITAETPSNEENQYIVSQEIWFHGFLSSDLDEGDELSYTWEVERPSASDSEVFVMLTADEGYNPEDEDPKKKLRCLVIPDVPGTYVVYLTVSDGNRESTATSHINVAKDGAPCIRETSPADASIIPLLVFDFMESHRFEVLRVEDDLDPYPPAGGISFNWEISENKGQSFLPVSGYHEPYLDIYPGEFSPGQEVWIRVKVSDRKTRELECGVEEIRCSLVAGCPQWVTWKIEFR